MTQSKQITVASEHADVVMKQAERLLSKRYGDRPGFELRNDLALPRSGWVQEQLNLFVGSRAGLQLRYQQRDGAASGILSVRECGWLEYRIKASAMFFGFVISVCAFLFLLFDGLVWNRFIARSVAFVELHFHFGTVIFYALMPAVLAGFMAGALAWPLSLLARPFCRVANRVGNIESPSELIASIQSRIGST